MSVFESIIAQFNGHIEHASRNIEALIPQLAEATQMLSGALLGDKKIICCTSADNFFAGQQFCHHMLNGSDIQRPGLPALFLGNNSSTILSLAEQQASHESYSRQIHAFGQPGDILFLLATNGNTETISTAIEAAHDKEMPIVALLSAKHAELTTMATQADIFTTMQTETLQQALLLNQLISVILASQIEQQLFGSTYT